MGCDQGTVNGSCTSAQSFCILNGQSVAANTDIDKTLSSITQNQTSITDTIWNRIHTVLRNIYNYGERGTRNPSVDNLSDVSDNDSILLSLYNKILSNIGVSNASGNPTVTKTLMDSLQSSIDNYQLNSDRCNSCNTACNSACEANSQSGGGGGEGCSCFCLCGRQGGEGSYCGGDQVCTSSSQICSTQAGCCESQGSSCPSYGSCPYTTCSTIYYKY